MNGGGEEEVVAPSGPPQPLEWKFSQVFGERAAGEEVQEVDIISAIEFDKSGDHLATGDRGGGVVLFERTDNRDFDYLKSLEIEEKINKIRWCQTANGALFLISTNDKTIKFWKVQEKKVKKISDMNLDPSKTAGNGGLAGSSISTSPKQYLASGGSPDRSSSYLNNNLSFPPGGFLSLRLPVVVSSHETSMLMDYNLHGSCNSINAVPMCKICNETITGIEIIYEPTTTLDQLNGPKYIMGA